MDVASLANAALQVDGGTKPGYAPTGERNREGACPDVHSGTAGVLIPPDACYRFVDILVVVLSQMFVIFAASLLLTCVSTKFVLMMMVNPANNRWIRVQK